MVKFRRSMNAVWMVARKPSSSSSAKSCQRLPYSMRVMVKGLLSLLRLLRRLIS